MTAKELRIGDHVTTKDPNDDTVMTGNVVSLCHYPVNGITIKLDGGGTLFIARKGIQNWKFKRI